MILIFLIVALELDGALRLNFIIIMFQEMKMPIFGIVLEYLKTVINTNTIHKFLIIFLILHF